MPAPHLVCTAVRPPEAGAFNPRWRTETAVLLARGIVSDSAPDRLPILADALEEAGCDDPATLSHCRECGLHTVRCWVLTDVLERLAVAADAPRLTEAEVRRELEEITGRRVVLSSDPGWTPATPQWIRGVMPVIIATLLLCLLFLFCQPSAPPISR